MAIVGEVCQSGTLSTLTGSTLANVCITASGEAGDCIVPFGEATGILGGTIHPVPRTSHVTLTRNTTRVERLAKDCGSNGGDQVKLKIGLVNVSYRSGMIPDPCTIED